MGKHTKKIAVIGAGIAGLTAAYYLAKRGHTVSVYDQELYPAMRCSYANGGQLSVSNSETWHSWGNVWKGIKWLFKDDAPLLLRPGLDPARLAWISRFLLNTARGSREANTIKTIALGLESRRLYQEIAAEEGIQFQYTKSGILHFYKDEQYLESAYKARSMYEDNGCQWRLLTPAEVYELEPRLANSGDILGGAWTEEDGVGNIHTFCSGLMEVLKKKYHVSFYAGEYVDRAGLNVLIDLHDCVVVSAGAESGSIASALGDRCTIYPVKGYSITVDAPDPSLLPQVSLLDDQAKIVSSTLGGKLRVAGTAELAGYNYDIRRDRIKPLLDWVHTNFPSIDARNYTQWACLRPMTADMLPMVGKSRVRGVYYHTGHGHLGWTVCPATAVKLADLIQDD